MIVYKYNNNNIYYSYVIKYVITNTEVQEITILFFK